MLLKSYCPPQATPYMYIPQQDPQSWKPKIIMMLRTCSTGGGGGVTDFLKY